VPAIAQALKRKRLELERKQVENELEQLLNTIQQERDRRSALIGSITDKVWFVDPQENFTLINPSGRSKFHISIEEEVKEK